MLRHLRTHNRTIMAVGGTLLLVSWALGGALSSLSSNAASRGAGWATVGASSKKLTADDLASIQEEMAVIEALGDPLLNQIGASDDPSHWYLLSREATDAGLVGGLGDGRLRAEEIAMAINVQNKTQGSTQPDIDGTFVVRAIMSKSRASERGILNTLSKVNGVHRLNELYSSMPRFSDSRLRVAASKALSSVACDVVALDARTLALPEIPEPSETELQAQLAKYGEKKPNEGEFGFGYRLPDRVKVEWIEIPIANVRAAIEGSNALDSITLKKRFAENPAKFGVTDASLDALALFPVYESTVRQRVLDELVAERMNEITKFASDQLALAQRGLPKDGGFFRLPEDWSTRKPNLQTLCDQIGEQFAIAAPFYGSTGGQWNSSADLKTLREIGTASTTKFGANALTFTQLIERTKELGQGSDTTPIQKDVVGPPLTATSKSVFFFRVTDVDPSRAPTSAAEAGDTLKRDVIAEDRYAALKQAEADLLNLARTEGIRALADRYGAKVEFAPRVAETNPQMLAYGIKMAASLPGVGANDAAVRTVIDLASKLPLDKPIADVPEADRTFLFPLDDKLIMVAVRITDVTPLTLEDFQMTISNPRAKDGLLDATFKTAVSELLSFESLKKRHNFHLIREKDEEEPKTEGDADKSAAPKA
ncbi:MAG: hypothetical protein JNL80_09705 [Phycisphaerae bacterium]|jgi:hypothetical protein|nr:hypothetical protein [Phycisphaerae bacterium]